MGTENVSAAPSGAFRTGAACSTLPPIIHPGLNRARAKG
jgi:hypothetical protein